LIRWYTFTGRTYGQQNCIIGAAGSDINYVERTINFNATNGTTYLGGEKFRFMVYFRHEAGVPPPPPQSPQVTLTNLA
jgi:hypothetical protein